MEQSQGEILPNLLIDACGWVAVVDSGMNIDLEINRTIGPSDWILPNQVKLELEKMGEQRTNLLLDLLFSRAEVIESNHKHTDDALLILAKETGSRVLTVDKELKRRLIAEGCGYLEVVKDCSLRLIE
ncbi:MAG: hypothetical protein CMA30_08500 [Euryarchaeota archaeon]|nr:hypothetical protein [Euryarchaeota archaeon]|tara:strand:+ start:2725 stop:3108 length:384 start_codon:yes stop_codon:yes gene_type:complete